jgi:hypothetical protein
MSGADHSDTDMECATCEIAPWITTHPICDRFATELPRFVSAHFTMQVYIFDSDIDPSVRAFTSDRTGSNLPAEFAPWRAGNAGKSMHIGSSTDPIAISVEADGYLIIRATV